MMEAAALVVALSALLACVALVLVARREAAALRGALAHVVQLVVQAQASAERARSHSEGARAEAQSSRIEAVAARSELRGMRELLQEIREETCGPITVRPGRLPVALTPANDGPNAPAAPAGTPSTHEARPE